MPKFFIGLTRDPISMIGSVITTVAGILIVSLFAIELIGLIHNPYVGILTYIVLPAFFVLGLILIPIGMQRHRRAEERRRHAGVAPVDFPIIDLNNNRTRNLALTFVALTAVNLVIVAAATVKSVEVLGTNEFCGTACHSVMHPEWTAFQDSPHASVDCVDCHIAPSAEGFLKAKLNGATQAWSTAFKSYSKPTGTPVHDLPPAAETCGHCHWPRRFVGRVPKVITKYEEDEANTELNTVLVLNVGGERGGKSSGIHWHADPAVEVRYRTDPRRETVWDIEVRDADGSTRSFRNPGAEAEDVEAEWRVMDCTDCHNRAAHQYQRPEVAVDFAIEDGRIPRDLPYVRREGMRLLQRDYDSMAVARQGIADGLEAFYASEYADLAATRRGEIAAAAEALAQAYERNVFPRMQVGWNSYPDHRGHEAFDGCFRCHTDEHATAEGRTVTQDCEVCHSVVAWDEEDPEILQMIR